ncbi:hypothetical protein OROHE_006496 [Orobanche hederae]
MENSITSTDVERDNAILQKDCKSDGVQLDINPATCKASVFLMNFGFSWPYSWEDDVYHMWESIARIRYRDYIHDMKVLRTAGDLGRPDYCSEEMCTCLCHYWDSPEAHRRSEAARMNRMSEPEDQVLELASI